MRLTDASGNFVFSAVAPGNYYLCEQGGPAPNTPQQTFPATDGTGGACATHTGVAGSRGYAITLAANQAITAQDFGNFFGGMVSGQKFSDLADDGVQDAGDPRVPGMQIILIDKGTGGGTVNLTTNTDASGNFSFGLILPGEYYLCEQAGPAPNIPAQTFPATDESSGACATRTGIAGSRGYDIVLGVNGTSSNKDFGNFYGGTLTVNKVLVPAADAGRFNLQIDGTSPNAGSDNVGDGGTTGAVIVNAGSHELWRDGRNRSRHQPGRLHNDLDVQRRDRRQRYERLGQRDQRIRHRLHDHQHAEADHDADGHQDAGAGHRSRQVQPADRRQHRGHRRQCRQRRHDRGGGGQPGAHTAGETAGTATSLADYTSIVAATVRRTAR